MARLIVFPIEDRGDCVLVVTRKANIELIGFVAKCSRHQFFRHEPSMCECVSFVDRNLAKVEELLLQKSKQKICEGGSDACIELTAADLIGH